jgi:hypothetical protein
VVILLVQVVASVLPAEWPIGVFGLATMIGFVLDGSQALSRSLDSQPPASMPSATRTRRKISNIPPAVLRQPVGV